MKKFGKFFVAALCFLSMSAATYAQDVEQATEIYNQAATALNDGDKAGALANFEKALTLATEAGEAGTQLVSDCKGIIPKILLQLGKDEAAAKNTDGAIAKLKDAAAKATEFGQADVAKEATDFIPQILLAGANNLLNGGKFAEAAAEYKKVTELLPENGVAYLREGMALSRVGDEDGALAAYAKASEFGQKAAASKQVTTLLLKKTQATYKAGKYAECIAAANQCLEAGANPAATYFLAMSYVKTKENEKACAEFKKIQADPKYKAAASQYIPYLKCN